MKIVAGYTRVSVLAQKYHGCSIDKQLKIIESYFKTHYNSSEYKLMIFKDDGFDGHNIDRPAFKKMCNLIKENKVSDVVFVKLDRLSRNTFDTQKLIKLFKQHKINMISILDNVDYLNDVTENGLSLVNSLEKFETIENIDG